MEEPAEVRDAWQRLFTADGTPYVYNHILKVTRWSQEESQRRSIKLAKRLSGMAVDSTDSIRAKVLAEIVETESTYNRNMHVLLDVFAVPLQGACGPTKAQLIRPLFTRALAIVAKSDTLLSVLQGGEIL